MSKVIENEVAVVDTEATENTEVVAVVEPKVVPQMASIWNNTKMFNHAYKLAGFLAQSDLIPQSYYNKQGNCLIAIDIANRMGVSPMVVMQNSQVVHGKFTWTGSACKAMIDGCGRFRKPTRYVEVGNRDDDSWGYYLEGETKDGNVVKGVTVTVAMAKAEGWYSRNPKWKNMTELMLKYRASAFFMRTECAGLAMGFLTSDEQEDITYESPAKPTNLMAALDEE
jgi:hypothetical protein